MSQLFLRGGPGFSARTSSLRQAQCRCQAERLHFISESLCLGRSDAPPLRIRLFCRPRGGGFLGCDRKRDGHGVFSFCWDGWSNGFCLGSPLILSQCANSKGSASKRKRLKSSTHKIWFKNTTGLQASLKTWASSAR